MSDKTTIPVLTGVENFQIWKLRITGKLRMEKVYDVLLPSNPADPSPTSAESAAATVKAAQEALEEATTALVAKPDDKSLVEAVTAAQRSLQAARELASSIPATASTAPIFQDSWTTRDSKAHGIISSYISDRLALETANETSALGLFNKLVEIHENTNVGVSAFYTFVGMVNSKWDGDITSIQDHIATLRAADAKLTALKKPIDPEFLAFLLLHSLPDDPTWETFKSSVLNSLPRDSSLTFSDLSERLSFTATRLQGTSESAFKAKPSTTNGRPANSKYKGKQPPKKCDHHPDSVSHTTDQCFIQKKLDKEKAESKGKGKKRQKDSSHKAKHHPNNADSDSDSSSNSETESGHYVTAKPVSVDKALIARIQV